MTKMKWENRGGGASHIEYPPRPKPKKFYWKHIVTKYESTCIYCNTTIAEGTKVKWRKGKGVACLGCPQGKVTVRNAESPLR